MHKLHDTKVDLYNYKKISGDCMLYINQGLHAPSKDIHQINMYCTDLDRVTC